LRAGSWQSKLNGKSQIFECGPQGADKKVCEILLKKLDSTIQTKSITLDSKPNLVQKCGIAAKQLLETEKCDRVIILWDLYPAWRTDGEKPCRKADRESIFESLDGAGVDRDKVHLICITEELEAWLIADGGAISTTLSKPTHQVTVADTKKPEQVKNPKKRLFQIYPKLIPFPLQSVYSRNALLNSKSVITPGGFDWSS
jgi:hypothetical protein